MSIQRRIEGLEAIVGTEAAKSNNSDLSILNEAERERMGYLRDRSGPHGDLAPLSDAELRELRALIVKASTRSASTADGW